MSQSPTSIDAALGNWKTKKRSPAELPHFISEHPDMLGIVLELRDVVQTI